jgi:hypothetical protein
VTQRPCGEAGKDVVVGGCGSARQCCGHGPSDLRHAAGRAQLLWRQVASVALGSSTHFVGSSGLLPISHGIDGSCFLKDKDRWASASVCVSAMVLERCGGQQLCNPGVGVRQTARGVWWLRWREEAWCGASDSIQYLATFPC